MKKETPEQALIRLLKEAGAKIIDCTPRKKTENSLPEKKRKKNLK